MPDATTDPDAPCPIGACADIVCSKWTILVIRDLIDGPMYYREIQLSLAGISPRTLCERLKTLAEHGFVERTYIKAVPPRTRYELTDKGRALAPLLEAMHQFGTEWLAAPRSEALDAEAV